MLFIALSRILGVYREHVYQVFRCVQVTDMLGQPNTYCHGNQ